MSSSENKDVTSQETTSKGLPARAPYDSARAKEEMKDMNYENLDLNQDLKPDSQGSEDKESKPHKRRLIEEYPETD